MKAVRLVGCMLLASLVVVGATLGQDKQKQSHTDGVIVLINVKTEGIAEGAKLKQIEAPKNSSGKREIKTAKSNGKDQPRLNGIWVVKECTIVLADGSPLGKREVLIAIEVGNQTLKDLKYVGTCEAQSDKGADKWYVYTAECEVRE